MNLNLSISAVTYYQREDRFGKRVKIPLVSVSLAFILVVPRSYYPDKRLYLYNKMFMPRDLYKDAMRT